MASVLGMEGMIPPSLRQFMERSYYHPKRSSTL